MTALHPLPACERRRRGPRIGWLTVLAAAVVAAGGLAGCGGGEQPAMSASAHVAAVHTIPVTAGKPPVRQRPAAVPSYPQLLGNAQSTRPTAFVPAARVQGQTAVWIARSQSGIALLSFDQRLVTLTLHSGTVDAGGSGWRWGPEVAGAERRKLVAAFNGGFKFDTGAGGFMSDGRVAVPLRDGLGSIVTYGDGATEIGSWHGEVPQRGRPVVAVRQNLALLIDHGRAAPNLDCLSCWGATLGGVSAPARSALGITAHGRLIWAGGEHATVSQLASALLGARVVSAVQLDINPEWVAGYLYGHRGGAGPLAPVAVIPDQPGVPGQFLSPYGRDFFAVQAR